MKKIVAIFKNKEVVNRIFFTVMILFIIRIGDAITVPWVTTEGTLSDALEGAGAIALMDLLGGGALANFSIFALGVSPYITSQIIIQLLSKDVLPTLTELSRQGEYGRKKQEMAVRYLTLLLGAVQAYGIIQTMESSEYISFANGAPSGFWLYAYLVTVMLAGTMLLMWLGDQITEKGLGNGISVIIFAGCVRSLPSQITNAWDKYITQNSSHGTEIVSGSFQFALYILVYVFIIAFVVFIEMSRRKIPVQHAGKSGQTASMSRASYLPLKLNSSGVLPVIFASAILSAPLVVASFVDPDLADAEWMDIFDYSVMYEMPWFNDDTWEMPWGLLIYIFLIIVFCFFYAQMQVSPEKLAENFQKNGSYIPGVRPGKETERYVSKVLNRITCMGSVALALVAALPSILILSGVFGNDTSLAMGGTGMIIIVGVAIEMNSQIDGLLAGKSWEEVQMGGND